MTTPAQAFAHRIADMVGCDERNFQRAVGATWSQTYQADWNVWHEVVEIALAPERPFVSLEKRVIYT